MKILSNTLRFCLGLSFATLIACGSGDEPVEQTCADDCFLPRAPLCEGDSAYVFSIPGECVSGQCVFPFTVTDCAAGGGSCSNGTCVDPPDPCEGVACDSPPAPICDGDVVVTSTSPGTCNEGDCSFATTRSDCVLRNQICVEGRCTTPVNLCAGIICDDAPENTCETDTEVAIRFSDDGACNAATGECEYPETTVDCAETDEFCDRGRCETIDPCDGVTCNTPPAVTCVENVAVSYAPRGTCSSVDCTYIEIENDCGDRICEDGACRAALPCEGIVCESPPAGECAGDTLIFYQGPGTCSDNVCNYEERTQDCTTGGQVCQDGACVDRDPCTGIDCRVNPAGSCEDDLQVRFRDGVCVEGTCEYTRVEVDCAETGLVCLDGACESDDPCLGVTCRSPQAPYCEGETAIVEAASGTCRVVGESFVCDYAENTENCGLVSDFECISGACVFVDPCIGVTCPPRAASCDGPTNTYVEFDTDVECIDGGCDYAAAETRTDCDDIGGLCLSAEGCVPPGELLSEADLAITELFVNVLPDSSFVLWMEITNPYASAQRINGLEIALETDANVYSHIVQGNVSIPAFGSVVVGVEDYGIPGAYSMDDPTFYNALLELSAAAVLNLVSGDELVVSVEPLVIGLSPGIASVQLDPVAADPTSPSAWCESVDQVEFGFASPALPNHACSPRFEDLSLFISEVMADGPTLPFGKDNWFELLNQTANALNLRGIDIYYGPPSSSEPPIDEFVRIRVNTPFIVPANGGRNLVATTSVNVGGIGRFITPLNLNPTEGQIILKAADFVFASFEWGSDFGLTVTPSASIEIDSVAENLGPPFSPGSYCVSGGEYGPLAAANGTPGFGPVCAEM
jgi:hypothetical protein